MAFKFIKGVLKDRSLFKKWGVMIKNLNIIKSLKKIRFFGNLFFKSIKEFSSDKCYMQASALTFYSLIGLVPFLAIILAISKMFGFEDFLKKGLLNSLDDYKEVVLRILEYSSNLIKFDQGIISNIGIIFLFLTAFKLIVNVEEVFNHIWRVKKSRSWFFRFINYFAIIILAPIIWFVSSLSGVFILSKALMLFEKFAILNDIYPSIFLSIKVLPYFLVTLVFVFAYKILPNSCVKFSSAFVGGVVAGTLYQILQIFYLKFQFFFFDYSAVYGSFAAFPLFLIWIQLSWVIILFGAEIGFVFQHRRDLFNKARFN